MCTVYFDCERGAAGDMICAALFGLIKDKAAMVKRLNNMGIPGAKFLINNTKRYEMEGLSMTVEIGEQTEETVFSEHGHTAHRHMTMETIREIVGNLKVPQHIKKMVLEIYQMIALAESEAHNCQVTEVHFHEVGALDAIADVSAACMLLDELKPENIISSSVHVGNGTVRCAHGVLDVPAPATANLLRGIPYEKGEIEGEICTPTGAALLRYFVQKFGVPIPESSIKKSGIGIGKRKFQKPSFFMAAILAE